MKNLMVAVADVLVLSALSAQMIMTGVRAFLVK